jgi:hypothetical protein
VSRRNLCLQVLIGWFYTVLSHWCKRTLPSTGPRSDHLVTLLHLLRKCRKILPEVTSLEITWPEMTSTEVTWPEVIACACPDFFPRFFLTIVVVQNVPLCMTGGSMATGSDVFKRHVTQKRGSLGRVRNGTRTRSLPVRGLLVTSLPVRAASGDIISGQGCFRWRHFRSLLPKCGFVCTDILLMKISLLVYSRAMSAE